MTTGAEYVLVGAYWRDRKYTARQFIEACHRFLSELKDISALFSNRCTTAQGELFPLPDDLPSFTKTMSGLLADSDNVYTNPDNSIRSFTLDSTLPQGFVAAFSDCNINATEENTISIFVAAGAHGHPNATGAAFFRLPPAHTVLVNDSVRRTLLLSLMTRAWFPEFATITSKELVKILDPERNNGRSFGPLMYFKDTYVEGVVANTPHVRVVRPPATTGVTVAIDAPLPWAESADMFKPCYEKLKQAGLLAPAHL